jgi:hypothetical protein
MNPIGFSARSSLVSNVVRPGRCRNASTTSSTAPAAARYRPAPRVGAAGAGAAGAADGAGFRSRVAAVIGGTSGAGS